MTHWVTLLPLTFGFESHLPCQLSPLMDFIQRHAIHLNVHVINIFQLPEFYVCACLICTAVESHPGCTPE